MSADTPEEDDDDIHERIEEILETNSRPSSSDHKAFSKSPEAKREVLDAAREVSQPFRSRDLAGRVDRTPSSIGIILKRLEEDGEVEKERYTCARWLWQVVE